MIEIMNERAVVYIAVCEKKRRCLVAFGGALLEVSAKARVRFFKSRRGKTHSSKLGAWLIDWRGSDSLTKGSGSRVSAMPPLPSSGSLLTIVRGYVKKFGEHQAQLTNARIFLPGGRC